MVLLSDEATPQIGSYVNSHDFLHGSGNSSSAFVTQHPLGT